MIHNQIPRAYSWRKSRILSLVVAGLVLCTLMPTEASACTVPVFRYALEHWPASPYRLAVLHRGELSLEQKEALGSLLPTGVRSLDIETYDVSEELPEGAARDQWEAAPHSDSLPYGLLFLPTDMRVKQPLVWQGALNEEGLAELKSLVYSPLMRQTCRALATGDSAAWLILKGQDEEVNKQTRTLLDDALAEMQDNLKLPHELDPSDSTYSRQPAPGVPLKKHFSVHEADLDAPKNEILRQILIALAPDSELPSGPMVMPMFGRGRALALLTGGDISERVFWEINSFLVGPCSCKVKQLNPGFDLLAPFPWDEILYMETGVEQAIANLPGTPREEPLQDAASLKSED